MAAAVEWTRKKPRGRRLPARGWGQGAGALQLNQIPKGSEEDQLVENGLSIDASSVRPQFGTMCSKKGMVVMRVPYASVVRDRQAGGTVSGRFDLLGVNGPERPRDSLLLAVIEEQRHRRGEAHEAKVAQALRQRPEYAHIQITRCHRRAP